MTPHLSQMLAACGPGWRTAQEIANLLPGRLPGNHITPSLRRLERAGHLIRDETGATWHRWRLR